MSQAVYDPKVVNFFSTHVVFVCGLEASVVRIEVVILLLTMKVIRHLVGCLLHGNRLLSLDHLPQLLGLPGILQL